MRFLAALIILLAAVPAAAQTPTATLEAIRRDFPLDHQSIAATLAGKAADEARSLAYAGIDRFLRSRSGAILAAPGPALVEIEARQGALLRALGRQDVRLCATVGDRGFFSSQALAGLPPAGLDDYGVALVRAAKAGSGAVSAAPTATKEDFTAWLAAVAKIEPGVPVRDMLFDKDLRSAASADHLCRGAAAMHEAVAVVPAASRERLARTLLRSVIAPAATP
ncbi:MAG TPA: hypothetical protein VF574_14775 [Allosphingosinicella sp.]|jgi:hypothetical protein